MANLGDKLTVGDREGVLVRAVATAEGEEVTIRIPNDERPVSHPLTLASEDQDAVDEKYTGDDKAPAKATDDKAPAKATDDKAPAKATGNKAAGSK